VGEYRTAAAGGEILFLLEHSSMQLQHFGLCTGQAWRDNLDFTVTVNIAPYQKY
jgi:hypothetical protein